MITHDEIIFNSQESLFNYTNLILNEIETKPDQNKLIKLYRELDRIAYIFDQVKPNKKKVKKRNKLSKE